MALDKPAFADSLRAVGAERYHDRHPFQVAMNAGSLTKIQIHHWIYNRYYYQKSIPIKDAAILANLPDRDKRRVWVRRIVDHDGTLEEGGGGIEMWVALARASGLDEGDVLSERFVNPGARFAVDAYVNFARSSPWLPGVASSLTELFAPNLMARRITALCERYPWIDPRGLEYFRTRMNIAPRDAAYTLDWVLEAADTQALQNACVAALRFKCDVLWALLDATERGAADAVRAGS
ncbi:MAG TPA: pyrroloquinoline-quinone synthase PqqC [Candidatus Eremiobacteraceae bacterium]|nr:pyrroloquinoline-quinone synthase PqqC [Candidatus Eremiobacteraceae bacterium]